MKLKRWQIIFQISCLFLTTFCRGVFAEGIGGMASSMMEPVSMMSDFMFSACLVLGASFLFAAIIKYVEHRNSPLMVPISTVIFLFVAAVALIAIPFLSLLPGSAFRYSLFR